MNRNPGSPNPQVQQVQQLFSALTMGRKVVLIAGVVGLLDSFLHWYSASASYSGFSASSSESGWHGWALIAVLLFVLSAAWIALPMAGIQVRGLLSSLPPTVTEARLIMGAGALALLCTILFMVTEGSGASAPGFSEGPSFGAYIGAIVAIAIAAGGYLIQSEPTNA